MQLWFTHICKEHVYHGNHGFQWFSTILSVIECVGYCPKNIKYGSTINLLRAFQKGTENLLGQKNQKKKQQQ